MYRINEHLPSELDKTMKSMSFPFQGKDFHPQFGMIYWFTWGEWSFDIRDIRKLFNRKEEKKIDMDFKMHPCTRFRTQMLEIVKLIGKQSFEDFLIKHQYTIEEEAAPTLAEKPIKQGTENALDNTPGTIDDLPF